MIPETKRKLDIKHKNTKILKRRIKYIHFIDFNAPGLNSLDHGYLKCRMLFAEVGMNFLETFSNFSVT